MRSLRRLCTVLTTTLVALSAAVVPAVAAQAGPPPVYPAVGPGTHLLDHPAKLAGLGDPGWYEANIPFVDLPDKAIEDTYYYRWRTFKEALKYTGPEDGWIVSEFLGPVGYSAPGGGIDAASGHHLYEGRWLRDPRYLDDYVDYWLRGSGAGPKPATDGLNENTTDWAHEYSFWAADAVLARASVDGRWDFAVDRLPELQRQWAAWAPQFDPQLGLYWQVPVWDAMEYTASSYQSPDPYHGGAGFRPTLNAYQYGDAQAIANLLRRRGAPGDRQLADSYDRDARGLQANQDRVLWDSGDAFYKHVMRDGNPARTKIADREEMGFVPWYFHMAPAGAAAAWAQLTDPAGFAAPFGPTTVERRSPWFMHDAAAGCCRWSGPSWPYATSQTLTALANLLTDYPPQPYVSTQDYYALLRGYALTQRKNGVPYVAEAHHPDEDRWLYDSRGHSEDYNHSTFDDLVLSGLLGIRPQQGDHVRLAPLVPAAWDHFAVENVPYHGRNLTVAWDRDGHVYRQGAGLSVWLDGKLVHRQAGLTAVDVPVRPGKPAAADHLVDDLANPARTGYPAASASYTWPADSPANAIDGQDFDLDVPSTRWTSYGSPNRDDWLAVDLGAATDVSDVRISFYDDGGGVRTPDSFALQYRAADGTWADLPGGQRDPATPVRGRPNRVVVQPAVRTDGLRVRPSRVDGGATGITAVQAWRAEDDRLRVRLQDDPPRLRPGQTAEITGSVRSSQPLTVRPALTLPRGWTAQPVGPAGDLRLTPGRDVPLRWRVTAPADTPVGTRAPARLLVSTLDHGVPVRSTADLVGAEVVFDPADFATPVWDDDFTGDRLNDYRVGPRFGEPVPALSQADGALVASASRQSAAVLVAPVAAPAGDFAVVLEPRSFAGSAPEDSVLLGRAAGPDDLALAWYNHHFGTSGADVRAAGRDYGDDVTGGCCAAVEWSPGDRFAVVSDHRGGLTSWLGHQGRWQLLRTIPGGPVIGTGWSPAIGLRLTSGQLALERLTVVARGPA
ncbi:discoidin domain-containing protein [Amycolatopsis sp. Hca4]|uniref:MGH1-like glycoside hydrolase domain-containing protein n=1 Tax=Amycolatopsis sp. Hca4 TaxID=2742131 RepID=UPI001591245C|nr:discoidin domain-containing protein [Amycolatopsis sp. Hca4]QKV80130.1 discoidin domain-containing protein [Amycolatopsis sp. Hca4]